MADAEAKADTALVVVDFQNEYFGSQGGAVPLVGVEEAAKKGAEVLKDFRDKKRPIVHVYHIAPAGGGAYQAGSKGAEIHDLFKPADGEHVLEKHRPSSFHNTKLDAILKEAGVKNLVLIGAMSHMCINSTARYAMNLGYATAVVDDACATRDITRGDNTVSAKDVHDSTFDQLALIGTTLVTAKEVVEGNVEFKQAGGHDWVS